jgi:hypothetical protein
MKIKKQAAKIRQKWQYHFLNGLWALQGFIHANLVFSG